MLLVLHAESLLFIKNYQTQILEAHIRREHPVGADYHVDGAITQTCHHLAGFFVGVEPREPGNLEREWGVALRECRKMLLHQQSSRDQNGNLFTILHRLECSTYGYLSFAVTNVTANKPIHRNFALHINFDFVNARKLVWSLHICERILKFSLPRRIWPKCMALGGLTSSVKLDQFTGDLLNSFAGTPFRFLPIRAAQAVHTG
ncbi:unannotated protein [freshwater metagenome]|uniref:Unannotated protein n=1 Tax=freshwater metagenome TaxID=449393 RepID=A0A6J7ASQ4_9ZZZZ